MHDNSYLRNYILDHLVGSFYSIMWTRDGSSTIWWFQVIYKQSWTTYGHLYARQTTVKCWLVNQEIWWFRSYGFQKWMLLMILYSGCCQAFMGDLVKAMNTSFYGRYLTKFYSQINTMSGNKTHIAQNCIELLPLRNCNRTPQVCCMLLIHSPLFPMMTPTIGRGTCTCYIIDVIANT